MELFDITSNIGAYIRDAILITEAEPVIPPGPRVLWCNKAFTLMTGYFPPDIIGKTPRILQGPDTDPETTAAIREALQNRRPIRCRLVNYTKSGAPFFIELDIRPIADESGWHHFWISSQREVDSL